MMKDDLYVDTGKTNAVGPCRYMPFETSLELQVEDGFWVTL